MLGEGRGTAWMAVERESGRPAGVFLTAIPLPSGKAVPGPDSGPDANTPEDYEENLGRDIGLPESELGKVAHMDSAAVLPAFVSLATGSGNRQADAPEDAYSVATAELLSTTA